jgi:hypothetical protein
MKHSLKSEGSFECLFWSNMKLDLHDLFLTTWAKCWRKPCEMIRIWEKKIAQRIELGVVNRLFAAKVELVFKSCSMYWAAPVHVLRYGQAVPPTWIQPFWDQGLLNHLCAQTRAAPNCKSDHKSQKWCCKSPKSGPIYHYQQAVCCTEALPFTLKSILRQKKNYGNLNISPCKNIIFQKKIL